MQIRSEWPGTVTEISVAVGDSVQEEDEVLILESMKMLTPVVSPATGRVSAIHVEVGDVVEEDAPLLSLE